MLCSEIEDENTINRAGCHNVREHKHKLRKYGGRKQFEHKEHTKVICIYVLTLFYSYVL